MLVPLVVFFTLLFALAGISPLLVTDDVHGLVMLEK